MKKISNKSEETINEHIRNALSPIVNLISIVEDKQGFFKDIDSSMMDKYIQASKKSVEILKTLGYNNVEPLDSEYFKMMKK